MLVSSVQLQILFHYGLLQIELIIIENSSTGYTANPYSLSILWRVVYIYESHVPSLSPLFPFPFW